MNNETELSQFVTMDSDVVRGPLLTETNLQKFQKRVEEKYGLQFENYLDFHRWSCENYSKYWGEVWDHFDFICSKTYDEVVDEIVDFADVPEWFRGAKLNYAENMLRYPDDDHVAIIATGEEKLTAEHVTFGLLRADVALLSSAFRNAGIQHGDAVACFLSNRKEAIVALLAAASVGAVYSSVNPLMGIKAIISRFQQISPKVLFTIDRFVYNRKEHNVLEVLPDIVRDLPTLTHVIIVPSKDDSTNKDISFIPKSQFLPDFLKRGLTKDGSIPPPKYDQLSFSHPLIINYTSGTTGQPKGIVHSAGAALLIPLPSLSFCTNIKSTDVTLGIYSAYSVAFKASEQKLVDVYKTRVVQLDKICRKETNFGYQLFIKSQKCAGQNKYTIIRRWQTLTGATVVLYDGEPFFRSETFFWDFIDEHQITSAFLTPRVLEELEKKKIIPGKHNSLKTLHTVVSGSSRIKSHTYDFVYQKIKPDVFFAEVFGSTEFITMFGGPNYSLPVYRCQLQVRVLGVDIQCYSEEGKPVFEEKGELVITKPFPSMPLYLCNDELKKKYRDTYFSKFPGVWYHGDICAISSKTGGMCLFGRSDETIKQRGARFGSAEIYNVMNALNEVADSICVSKMTEAGDEIAFLFVHMKEGHSFNAHLVQKIRRLIERELSSQHVPEIILCAPAIPYNLNGKKMEVLVKKILAGAQAINRESVSNPDCLSYYCDIAKMNVI